MNLTKGSSLELTLPRIRMVICSQIPTVFLNRWKNFFNQVLNVHGIHGIRQIDILVHMAKQLVPEPSLVEVEAEKVQIPGY
jgi:hypothetical protein